jgi:hypothetical protein
MNVLSRFQQQLGILVAMYRMACTKQRSYVFLRVVFACSRGLRLLAAHHTLVLDSWLRWLERGCDNVRAVIGSGCALAGSPLGCCNELVLILILQLTAVWIISSGLGYRTVWV